MNEQARTQEALKVAIQMEIDGKEFYLKASGESSNELGKKLLKSLAAEEDIHRQRFKEIFEVISDKKAWPRTTLPVGGGKELRTLFVEAAQELGAGKEAPATELDSVQTAIDMETKTYDYYKLQAGLAATEVEKEFYQALVGQEREHRLVLLDYQEYLINPAGWFVKTEHPSLDGG